MNVIPYDDHTYETEYLPSMNRIVIKPSKDDCDAYDVTDACIKAVAQFMEVSAPGIGTHEDVYLGIGLKDIGKLMFFPESHLGKHVSFRL
jgi:hypothetical protein